MLLFTFLAVCWGRLAVLLPRVAGTDKAKLHAGAQWCCALSGGLLTRAGFVYWHYSLGALSD